MLFRHRRINRRKFLLDNEPGRGKQFHAGQDHRNPVFPEGCDNQVDVLLHDLWRHPLEAVVCADFQDHDIWFEIDYSVQPFKGAPAGFPADAGVDAPPLIAGSPELSFKTGGIRIPLVKAVTECQTVAKGDDDPGVIRLTLACSPVSSVAAGYGKPAAKTYSSH